MRKSTSELLKRLDSLVRTGPSQKPRKSYCRPEIMQSLPIHRAAEMASLDSCPLRR